MGKPYSSELKNLSESYKWALNAPIEKLRTFIRNSSKIPMYTIGSGGSFTTATFASTLHQHIGMMSRCLTPLDFLGIDNISHDISILITTARGRNSDILSAFRKAVKMEPRQMMILCTTLKSPLARLAYNFPYVEVSEFEIATGKDGFLATNSLLVSMLLIARAYIENFSLPYEVKPSLSDLVHHKISEDRFDTRIQNDIRKLVKKNTLIVLYDTWSKPAAFDAESKFVEAGLVNIQLSDYRNFAHGRHHWLDKNKNMTGIIGLITPDTNKLATKTLNLIPDKVPIVKFETDIQGPLGTLALLIKIMYAVKFFGEYKKIDPGRPGVPKFGRRIYNLKIPFYYRKNPFFTDLSKLEIAAISRKINSNLSHSSRELTEFWLEALKIFLHDLENERFGAVVFDYDGTLCEPQNRYNGISTIIAKELSRLLKDNIIIGVASGRGKSVREDLQKKIPKNFWSNIIIGYYNGSDIGRLDNDEHPNKSLEMDPTLELIISSLKKNKYFNKISKYDCRPKQISFEPTGISSLDYIMNFLHNMVHKTNSKGVQILESSHSIDMLAPNVSKLKLVEAVETEAIKTKNLPRSLCIGDKGRWPGNDFELLSGKYSLSVDTVSPDPHSCWNLSLDGCRGENSVMNYLHAIEIKNNVIQFNTNKLEGTST